LILQEARRSTNADMGMSSALCDVFSTAARDEIVAKTTALEQLRAQNEVDEDVKAGRVERRLVPGLVDAAAKRYSEDTRRLRRVAEADKTKVQTKVIN